ncbi:MAG: molybdopterin-dependent oxidoreductase [Actinomycetota bacterium]
MSETAIRTCPLCEATCGLAITMTDGRVSGIRGDDDDVFSKGYICPKATTLGYLHEDPDRVRAPMIKREGVFQEVTWDEAFAEVERRLMPILSEHGRDAVAIYLGNPTVHNLDATMFGKVLVKSLGTHNVFSASTVDQRPKELSSALMFGGPITIPIPDLDRTDYVLMLGANPLESNGSLATAPDWPGRLRAIRARGGTIVVVDPRYTQTAEIADQHLPIRPGSDALFLAAIVTTLFAENLVTLGRLEACTNGVTEVREALRAFTAHSTASHTGIDAETTLCVARELAAAPTAVVYGRIGTTTQRFGTLASWLIDVINVLTGNLDRAGGAMFTKAAAGAPNTRGSRESGRETKTGRFVSRVRGLKETFGELPVACLSEEISTDGPGRVRALITVAGNPVVSTPDADALDRALGTLEFMVSVDIYLNETSRHADVILPPPSSLQRSHYDLAFYQLSVRNIANYSPPLLPLADGQPAEWEILSKLALIAQGLPSHSAPSIADDVVIGGLVRQSVADPTSPINGRTADEILDALKPRVGPDRMLDFLLRTGPYGDGFGAQEGLCLGSLIDSPHGIDLGPLEPRLPDALRTASGMIELAPRICLDDVPRMQAALDESSDGVVLVGRRHVRSNNSWFHNIPTMVKGKDRCTLHVHPDDALRYGLKDGEPARISSKAGTLIVPVQFHEHIRPGVVSLPHGWGHNREGIRMQVASDHAGVNSNVLTDAGEYDVPTGNAVLNGMPVELAPA